MPASRSIGLLLAVIAMAVGGFLLLRPSDDEPSSATAPAATTTPTPSATTTGTTTNPTATTAVLKPTLVRLEGGSPVGGKKEIEVTKGDTIRLTVTSDAPGEIHVHGFDIEKETAPGTPARFRFTADIEGRFEVESHPSDTQIAEITVNP